MPSSVDTLLRDRDTRAATLEALEAQSTRIDPAVSLAAAPVLAELLTASASEVGREQFDCIGLLLGRLFAEVADCPTPLFRAAFSDGRWVALFSLNSNNILAHVAQKPAVELTRADAFSVACWSSYVGPLCVNGMTGPLAAVGLGGMEWFEFAMGKRNPFFK